MCSANTRTHGRGGKKGYGHVMLRFRGPVPISIGNSFWLITFFMGLLIETQVTQDADLFSGFFWAKVFSWVFVVLVSLLVHEMGHALTALLFGQKAEISIAGFWGLTKQKGAQLSLFKEFLVVLNGPLASFLLFLVTSFCLKVVTVDGGSLGYLLKSASNLNYFWLIVNLLPVYPLDGGQLTRIALASFLGHRAIRYTALISIIVGLLLSIVSFQLDSILLGVIFSMLSFEAWQLFKSSALTVPEDQDQDYQERLEIAKKYYYNQELDLAIKNLLALRKDLSKGSIYQQASELLAQIYFQQEEKIAAFEILRKNEPFLTYESLCLYQQVLFDLRYFPKVLEVGRKVFKMIPQPQIAKLNALAASRQGKLNEALGWLRYLRQLPEINLKEILKQADFDNIRQEPSFLRFLNETFSDKS